MAALMALQGACGLLGSIALSRRVGRIGPDRGARQSLAWILAGLVLWSAVTLGWPTVAGMALVVATWGLGSFAFVSSQQARLATSAPELASASIALNSSSLYAGQAVGAAVGGVLVGLSGYEPLGPAAFATMLVALALSVRADRKG
jgi:predicted MFS family arabinose efflux permease